jgi:hypothetical protein
LPGCGRCVTKGLDCPGYDKQFRFVTGPLSRTRRRGERKRTGDETVQITIPLLAVTTPIPPFLTVFDSEHSETCRQKHFTDHFFTRTADLICLLEGPQNPFGESLRPLMQRSDALNYLVVAIAALHMANSYDNPGEIGVEAYAWHYRSLSLEILRKELQSRPESIEVLMIVLLLGSTESWFNEKNSASVHLDAAGKLILQKLNTDQGVPAFMAHWLCFMETLFSFVSDREGLVLFSPILHTFLHLQDATVELDPIVGSWGTLIPLVGRVGTIARRLRREKGFRNHCAGELDDLIDAAETDLLEWQHPGDYAATENYNIAEAYRLSALLTLYKYSPPHLQRRASLIAETNTPAFLSKLAQWTIEHLRQIPDDSKLWRMCSIPVLSAGQLITNPVDRDFLRCRQAALTREMQHASVTKIASLLHDVWKQRDAGSDIWWIDVLDASGSQILVN